jgi:hypothetical protein
VTAHRRGQELRDARRIEGIASRAQPITAIPHRVQGRTQLAQRLHGLPDGAAAHAERFRELLAGMELAVRQLGEHAGDERQDLLPGR